MAVRFGVLLVVWILCFLTLCACGDTDKPKQKTEQPKEAGDKISVSQAYFGDLSPEKLTNSANVKTLEKGSVVLLVFDALNAKHLGAYGYKRKTSPNIDALAGQGILFTDHVSNSSWTRPSFTTIITGVPKSVHGVELEGGWRLEPEIVTLAERFRKAGYRTAGFTGNPLIRKEWGFDQGFHVFEDPITLKKKGFFRDSVLIYHAKKWLENVGSKPFFLVLFMTSSHPPYRPPEEERRFLSELPAGEIIDHPFKEYKEPLPKLDHERIVAAYDDEIAYMDRQVGRLISYLKETKNLDRTVIALTADHGEIFGEHNCYLHAYHMWEPVLRVPMILKAPNIDAKGTIDDRPFTHVDIAPTLLDLVGISYPKKTLKGISLVDALKNPSKYRKRTVFSQYNAHGVRRQAIRNGPYKLVHHHKVDPEAEKKLDELHPTLKQPNPRDLPSLAWDGERYEYYNLIKDPGELKNVFKENKKRKELLDLLGALRPHLDKTNPSNQMTEEMIKALENAGYLIGAPDDQ